MTVVSFLRDGEVCGLTVNSFASVSLDPPLILFCPALTTRFALEVGVGDAFTVSILADHQQDVCLHNAGRPTLEREPWGPDDPAPPTVAGCLGFLRCTVAAMHAHGDHFVVIGEVSEFGAHSDRPPLLFFRGNYPMLDTK